MRRYSTADFGPSCALCLVLQKGEAGISMLVGAFRFGLVGFMRQLAMDIRPEFLHCDRDRIQRQLCFPCGERVRQSTLRRHEQMRVRGRAEKSAPRMIAVG